MRTFRALLPSLVVFTLLAFTALAQQQSLMLGSDTTTQPDGGIMRRVAVDAQGRLITGTTTTTDAGVSVNVPYCTVTQDRNTSVGTTPTSLPVLAGRWMTRVCNSPRNSGTPIITCTTDGTWPDAGLNSVGESLEVGDCATYTFSYSSGSAFPVRCVSDTASTSVSSWDCR